MNNSRIVDVSCAVVVILFCLLMRTQLTHIPREGYIFPMCTIYLLMGTSALLALRALLTRQGPHMTFFAGIPVKRWCIVSAIFVVQCLGAMYLSFKIFMGLGMLTIIFLLEKKHSLKNTVCNVLYVAFFLVFFQLFFTDIMHIYFPENLFY
ncbi:hypothetical protein [uncultured Mailhella sp.]|uniref:hypothetical protein n=1 Tax=uncultured Mailhella sp. TaxID=1981031 RepID=UPI0025E3725D|nr:hypothetical protein [uncultured Mailhella sp.]